MAKIIVGFAGQKGVGKDTAADVLVREHQFVKIPMAHALVVVCSKAFEIPMHLFQSQATKELAFNKPIGFHPNIFQALVYELGKYGNITHEQVKKMEALCYKQYFFAPRQILQFVGTDMVRNCVDPMFWCKAWKKEASRFDAVVASDVRFPNEKAFLQDLGGIVAWVKRPTKINDDGHISENALTLPSDTPNTIINEGDINSFEKEVAAWYTGSRAMKKIGL